MSRPAALVLTVAIASCTEPPKGPAETQAIAIVDVTKGTLAPGIEFVDGTLTRPKGRVGRIFAVFADPAVARASLALNEEKRPLAELESDALVVVNAGYFTPDWRPTGLLVSANKQLSPLVKGGGAAGSGVLVVEDQKVSLVPREAMTAPKLDNTTFAIQAGPRIIEPDGSLGIRSDDGARANRTVIGKDSKGRLAIVVVWDDNAGLEGGPTLFELQRLVGTDGLGELGFGLTVALNLDGGPSTGLHVRGEPKVALPETNRVLSVLAIRSRP